MVTVKSARSNPAGMVTLAGSVKSVPAIACSAEGIPVKSGASEKVVPVEGATMLVRMVSVVSTDVADPLGSGISYGCTTAQLRGVPSEAANSYCRSTMLPAEKMSASWMMRIASSIPSGTEVAAVSEVISTPTRSIGCPVDAGMADAMSSVLSAMVATEKVLVSSPTLKVKVRADAWGLV